MQLLVMQLPCTSESVTYDVVTSVNQDVVTCDVDCSYLGIVVRMQLHLMRKLPARLRMISVICRFKFWRRPKLRVEAQGTG